MGPPSRPCPTPPWPPESCARCGPRPGARLPFGPRPRRSVFTLAARQGELPEAPAGGRPPLSSASTWASTTACTLRRGARRDACRLPRPRPARGRQRRRHAHRRGAGRGGARGPGFLYGDLATKRRGRRSAPSCATADPRARAQRMDAGELRPDFGPALAHPTAGPCSRTARPPLLAFNVDLRSGDLELARPIAADLRESEGGRGVRAIGCACPRAAAQVTVNVHDHGRSRSRSRAVRPRPGRGGGGRARRPGPGRALEGFPEDVPPRGF